MAKKSKKADSKYPNSGNFPAEEGISVEVDAAALNVGNPAPKKKRHLGWMFSGLALMLFAGFGALIVTLAFVSDVTGRVQVVTATL